MKTPHVYRLSGITTIAFVVIFSCSTTSAQVVPLHPLDALTAREISGVMTVLRNADRVSVDETSRYPEVTLLEPPKEEVLSWKPGRPFSRRASVVVRHHAKTFEAIIDISQRKLLSWKLLPDVQPALMEEEWAIARELVRAHEGWRAAVRKRGVRDVGQIVCIPLTAGYFALPAEQGRRLVKVVAFDANGVENFWARPIEGLLAVVDLEIKQVIDVIDTGVVPIPRTSADYNQQAVGPLRKRPNTITMSQPEGPSFTLNGSEVSWQKWSFHVRFDPRLGPLLSTVRYLDQNKQRSVLYQGSLSELFVPYMDPSPAWYFRTYLDAGEHGIGKLAVPLRPLVDCPSNAVFFDAVFADDYGRPYRLKRIGCLFERYSGDIAWRHFESETRIHEARRRTELVLRFITAIGNYDYIFDWIFRQDGSITVAIGSSGVVQVKAVNDRRASQRKLHDEIRYGRMLAERTVGINHDHFFCFRLDLDVDGTNNSFLLDRLTVKKPEIPSPRQSIWAIDSELIENEQAAKLRINMERPALWRVINPDQTGALGYPVSYHVRPGTNALPLLGSNSFLYHRASFIKYNLWVTRYDKRERFAAGRFPNQNKQSAGLAKWTVANRNLRNRDIVVWYTLGFHHVVRSEDWPILPTVWHEFQLRPFDFFPRNPAIDLPK